MFFILFYFKRSIFNRNLIGKLWALSNSVQGQVSKNIFAPNGGSRFHYSSNITQIFPSFSLGIFSHVTRVDQSASENIWWIILERYLACANMQKIIRNEKTIRGNEYRSFLFTSSHFTNFVQQQNLLSWFTLPTFSEIQGECVYNRAAKKLSARYDELFYSFWFSMNRFCPK